MVFSGVSVDEIKFVSELWQVDGFLRNVQLMRSSLSVNCGRSMVFLGMSSSSFNKIDHHNQKWYFTKAQPNLSHQGTLAT
jgi:hypothetical protein